MTTRLPGRAARAHSRAGPSPTRTRPARDATTRAGPPTRRRETGGPGRCVLTRSNGRPATRHVVPPVVRNASTATKPTMADAALTGATHRLQPYRTDRVAVAVHRDHAIAAKPAAAMTSGSSPGNRSFSGLGRPVEQRTPDSIAAIDGKVRRRVRGKPGDLLQRAWQKAKAPQFHVGRKKRPDECQIGERDGGQRHPAGVHHATGAAPKPPRRRTVRRTGEKKMRSVPTGQLLHDQGRPRADERNRSASLEVAAKGIEHQRHPLRPQHLKVCRLGDAVRNEGKQQAGDQSRRAADRSALARAGTCRGRTRRCWRARGRCRRAATLRVSHQSGRPSNDLWCQVLGVGKCEWRGMKDVRVPPVAGSRRGRRRGAPSRGSHPRRESTRSTAGRRDRQAWRCRAAGAAASSSRAPRRGTRRWHATPSADRGSSSLGHSKDAILAERRHRRRAACRPATPR